MQKSWTEVIDVISSYSPDAISTTSSRNISQNAATVAPTGTANSNSTVTQNSQITIEQIKHVMEEVLKSTTLNVSSTTTKVLPGQNVNKIPVASVAPVEEILEDVEEVEEIEEIEDAEEVLEIAEAVDEIDEVEELSDVEEIEEIEEIDEAEEVLEIAEAVDEDEVIEVAQAIELDCLINDQKPEEEEITDVYIISENFPTVDNLFLEELCIGGFEIQTKKAPINFTVYNLDFSVPETQKEDYEEPLEDFLEEIEEADISETIQKPVLSDVKFTNRFSMVSFGMNLGNVQELQQIKEENTIVENEGVFSISEFLDYSSVSQNEIFKSLVNDVLKR